MPTIQVQLAITMGEDAAKAVAEILGSAFSQATITANKANDGKTARPRASRNAIFGDQNSPEDQSLLIDSKEAARLLKVSERTLWRLHHTGEMPPPIRIGRAVRWNIDALRKWVEEGCPASRRL
jgi:excisionase family DNA binding protein